MNEVNSGKEVRKLIFRIMTFLLLCLLVTTLSCREDTFPPPKFSARIGSLCQWTNKGWAGYTYKEEQQLLDDLCGYVQAESNMVQKGVLYAQFTNTLVNVPFFSTNGVQRTNEFPRGLYQPPYWNRMRAYHTLLERAQKRSLYTNRLDAFCLNLEMWSRLRQEMEVCPGIVETWMTLRYENCPKRWIEDDIRISLRALSNTVQDVECLLEDFYIEESDESQRAYKLFREVIGREARPRYQR